MVQGESQEDARRQLSATRRLIASFKASRQSLGLQTPATDPTVDLFDAISAETWHSNCRALAEAHCAGSTGDDTFVYLFAHESPARRGIMGAAHALEMPFVFGSFSTSTAPSF